MKTVMNHSQYGGLLKMIWRTDRDFCLRITKTKNMKKELLILIGVLLIIISTGCSKDDDSKNLSNNTESYFSKVQDTQCYTIRINGIDENGIVSGSIINKPEESCFTGYCVILFDKSDLLGQTIDSGDEINVMILSFKEVPVEGYTTGETHFYYCKVNIFKS